MVQLSRKPLSKYVSDSILESFRWLIGSLSQRDEVHTFLQDFLTRTERMMLAKRLAVALLIERGFGYREIGEVLKVSPSTVGKIQQLLDNGRGYRVAIKKLAKREELEQFWKDVRALVRFIGKGRRVW